jgi:uncharacterized protein YgiM (DUF1202 family)
VDQRGGIVTRALVALCAVLTVSSLPFDRARADDVEPYARIIVDRVSLHSGPGGSYRTVYLAERGEVFPIQQRATRGGYWFQVQLPDGTFGWVLGDVVYVHEVSGEEAGGGRFLPEVFAPPPLLTASGELSVTGGVLGKTFGFEAGQGGLMALRPTFYIKPVFGIELGLAASVSEGGRLFFGTVGGLINIFPDSPIVPYVVVGGGYALSDPNADTFLLESGSTGLLYGGGGLRIGFRYRITLRIEARAYGFFTPDLYVPQEELSGGITVFF